MKHLKQYKNFEINEELTRNQRMWLNVPRFISAFIGKKLLNIYPMLNFKWSEMKKKTEDKDYDPVLGGASGIPNQIKFNLSKVSKENVPPNLKWNMFLRDWNLYFKENSIPESDINSKEKRKTLYISKDDLKKGDYYHGERLSDRDVYSTTNTADPIVVLIAKFSKGDKFKELEQVIDDICIEMEQDFEISAKPYVNLYGSQVTITLECNGIEWSDGFRLSILDACARIKSMLESEGIKMECKQQVYVSQPEYWSGLPKESKDLRYHPHDISFVQFMSTNIKKHPGENHDEADITTVLIDKIYLQFKKV